MGYVRGKLVQLVAVLLIVTFLTFLLINLLPGGPEVAILGLGANEESIAQVRADLNLDDPLPVRYGRWLSDAAQGDLGESYVNGSTVSELLANRLGVTLKLMIYAMFLALIVAIPLGIATAYKADTTFDKVTGTVGLTAAASSAASYGFRSAAGTRSLPSSTIDSAAAGFSTTFS